MTTIAVSRSIDAPAACVFAAVADVAETPSWVEDVTAIEFLTERREGVGTRFRETRMMRGKPMVTELEVTEYESDRRVRMVTDSHGTIWDTTFVVEPSGDGSRLAITMDARPHTLRTRLMTPILRPLFRRGIERHADAVEARCEERADD